MRQLPKLLKNEHNRRSEFMTLKLFSVVLVFAVITPVFPQQSVNKPQLAGQVRAEFLHAWNGYKKYAWGHDDLKPLSKTYHDWYAQSLLMTPVDALDTMILMGLKDEAKHTREYIDQNLSFDKDIEVQNFEITIRLLGGLLSNYQLTGDRRRSEEHTSELQSQSNLVCRLLLE